MFFHTVVINIDKQNRIMYDYTKPAIGGNIEMKTINLSDKTINFTKDTQIIIPNTPFSDYIKRELTDKVVDRKPNADITVSKIVFSLGITDEVRSRFADN